MIIYHSCHYESNFWTPPCFVRFLLPSGHGPRKGDAAEWSDHHYDGQSIIVMVKASFYGILILNISSL